jgi:hypothetical protein
MRHRAAWRRRVVGGALAFAAIGAACSKAQPDGADGGSSSGPEDAAPTDHDGVGITLDAFPTVFEDAGPMGSGADSGTPTDAGTCEKMSPGDPCGLDPQCGCGSSQTCDFSGTTLGCVTAGSAPVGHGCASTASCAPGLTCFNGACRPYCSSSGDAGCEAKLAEGGTCVQIIGPDGGPIRGYDVCTFDCQLQDPNACGTNGSLVAGCVYDGVGGTDCEAMGLMGIGASCQSLNDCQPGLVCAGTCLPWCRVGLSPSDCGDGEACQTFAIDDAGGVSANGIEYGYCP